MPNVNDAVSTMAATKTLRGKMSIIVKTADELKTAIQNKEVDIHVTGDLADAIISQKNKRKIAKIGVGVGLAALALAPFTGGGSVAGFAAATAARTGLVMGATAAATGAAGVTAGHILAVTALTAVTFGGIALIKVIDKDYDVVDYKSGSTHLKAKKRKKD